ncbi:MAG: glycerophosphodiester phosphodiesterase [Betaproteobacteria bacterium]|nr:glycerophosphodiester phosphodiesterase [Betaproteobacteria bacterium]
MRYQPINRLVCAMVSLLLSACASTGRDATPPTESRITLLAHRALGQDYHREALGRDTCTAARWRDTGHTWLENTLPSMQAAFAAGADIVEFDVHPTTDGAFAVFHDWTLDCRTDGSGVTRQHSLTQLKQLDVGHGYTADGVTFPFRGKGIGMMPSLDEVLAAFPDKRFLINIKSRDPREGELLANRLAQLPAARRASLMAYGAAEPIDALKQRLPDLLTLSRRSLRDCLLGYLALGWLGHVPAACERSLVLVPINAAPWLAGFPERFVARMRAAGSEVFLVNDYGGEGFSRGIDTLKDLSRVPPGYRGGIWTDRADLLGSALRAQGLK